MMPCPTCGSTEGFQLMDGAEVCEEDTGYYDGEYLVCLECGEETDAEELERLNA